MEQGSAACRIVLRELSENITTLSNSNDDQRIELEKFHEKEREQHAARVWKQAEERNTKRAVCRAFGWKQATASATLVRAACTLVTKEDPWIVPLTGNLAWVNYRGKAITMAVPKQAYPRLPCQQGTMKEINQSRQLYTPAVAGYVNEMEAAFRAIEERGYCEVEGIRYPVFINVIIVADMAYLHKYQRRGDGSHACISFCFLCSINKKTSSDG